MIPAEIRAVERPKNTIVKFSYGKYNVILRTCVRFGKKNVPIDLGKVGEIVDGRYIPEKTPKLKNAKQARAEKIERLTGRLTKGKPGRPRKDEEPGDPDIKKYGQYCFVHDIAKGLLDELASCFDLGMAKEIYAMALLRMVDPGLTDRDLFWEYRLSFVSEFLPGLHLSEACIPAILSKVGERYNSIMDFMRLRVRKYAGDGLVAVDGVLKNYESDDSIFSAYSHKARQKCRKDLSVLLAFNVKTGVLVCSKTYIGSAPDTSTMRDFVKEMTLDLETTVMLLADDVSDLTEDGVLWDTEEELAGKAAGLNLATYDRGCNTVELAESLEAAGLAYIAPLKRNSALARDHGMWAPTAPLPGYEHGGIQYRKCKMECGSFLYSFRNPDMEIKERKGYLEAERRRENESNRKYQAALEEAREEAVREARKMATEKGLGEDAPLDQKLVDELVSKKQLPAKYVFDEEKYQEASKKFGVVVFRCPLDIAPVLVYLAYQYRWDLETEIDMYRNVISSDLIRVHDDLRVIAIEFINTVSQIMGSMTKRTMINRGLFQKYTQPQMMKALSYIWKRRLPGDNWIKLYTLNSVEKMVQELGLPI